MGPKYPRAGDVRPQRERGEPVGGGGGGPAHPALHPLRPGGGARLRLPGGGHHSVVLCLHHWPQSGNQGMFTVFSSSLAHRNIEMFSLLYRTSYLNIFPPLQLETKLNFFIQFIL